MNAEKITRASKSNLALAFLSLGRERRRDITIFYAFCRVIDDIADSTALSWEAKREKLKQWREWLRHATTDEPTLARDLRGLMKKYPITPSMLEEIITGVEMDLGHVAYGTFEDLRLYCHRVASAVGLVSIEIFGYRNPACKKYAIELGLALQMTNIIRDVDKDLANGRIYLPAEDMAQAGYSPAELAARQYNDRFVQLMQFEANRGHQFFQRAEALLPAEDRRSMVAARIMSSVYWALLRQMEADRFRVFERSYQLSKLAKLGHIGRHLLNIN